MTPGTAIVLTDAAALARKTGLHPDLVRRLIRSGAVDPFAWDAAPRLARLVRLRHDLGLNYAGAVLACDLLAHIDELEARLSRLEAGAMRRARPTVSIR
ncbi:MAG: chaperone modulatory protein CbpM [Solirubrobacterales bacterium]|nr:chaperone modulatory protein CbpM [Solirubrobacterales bacterium]